MGTPDFAVPAFRKIIESENHKIVAILTQRSKHKGRGMKLDFSPVQKLAEEKGIQVYSPSSLRSEESYKLINSIEADIIVVVAYGLIIPSNIINIKKYGCLNIHPSKLPKYRGAAPLQRTIINGERETALCIIQMDDGIDTGDIILQKNIMLEQRISFMELHDKCSNVGADLLIEALNNIESLPKHKQSQVGIVYANKLTKEEAKINWNEPAFKIDCKIRGMITWPGTYFCHEGKNIKVIEADYKITKHNYIPGQLINNDFEVACGTDILIIKTIQPANRSEMNAKDYLRGLKNDKSKIIFS